MKFKFLAAITILSAVILCSASIVLAQSSQQCIDQDGGKNYSKKGGISGLCFDCYPVVFGSNGDQCVDGSTLMEFYCVDESGFKREKVNCPQGCSNGACVESGVCYPDWIFSAESCIDGKQKIIYTDRNNCGSDPTGEHATKIVSCGCTPNWSCSDWSQCTNNKQTRTCNSSNQCIVSSDKPVESRDCNSTCTPSWQCSNWGSCINGGQTRTCTDANNCAINNDKPAENQPCKTSKYPKWQCTDWSPSVCAKNTDKRTRTCTDANGSGITINKPIESATCGGALGITANGVSNYLVAEPGTDIEIKWNSLAGFNNVSPSNCTVSSVPSVLFNNSNLCSGSVTIKAPSSANAISFGLYYGYSDSGTGMKDSVIIAPYFCVPNWQCGAWSSCGNGLTSRKRQCVDINNCDRVIGEHDWKNIPLMVAECPVAPSAGKMASRVIGQPDFTSKNPGTGKSLLNSPKDVAIDRVHDRLFVVDTENNRVLVYNLSNGNLLDTEADYVLGQVDFNSTVGHSGISQTGLTLPKSIAYDSAHNRLFVGDALRVMIYDVSTITNGMPAKYVLGRKNFDDYGVMDGDYTGSFSGPAGLAYDEIHDRLFVSDNCHNVLIFNTSVIQNYLKPEFRLGHQSSACPNPTTGAGFNDPRHLAYDSVHDRLFVADSFNSRILVFNLKGVKNGMNASNVLGQKDFSEIQYYGVNNAGVNPDQKSRLFRAFGVAYDEVHDRLFVGDTFNGRVIIFNTSTITNGMPAIDLLGRLAFSDSVLAKDQIPTQSTLAYPDGLAYDKNADRLYATDMSNNRVLAFDFGNPSINSYSEGAKATKEEIVNSLLQQVAQLQAQIAEILAKKGNINSTSPTTLSNIFKKNLGYSSSGSDEVGALHIALQKEGISYAPDTGNVYGEGTARAVAQFQEKYALDILKPLGLVKGTGYVGTATIVKLNALSK
jgi:DNA-binding beta-propeller fold protein YncE